MSQLVLLVDDSKFQRIANERLLTKAGYTVVTAADGEEAVRTAQAKQPALILLDMLLPKLDGVGVLRALKADVRTAKTPVIVLSGLSEANAAKLEAEGASGYLTKTVLENNTNALLKAVDGALHRVASANSAGR